MNGALRALFVLTSLVWVAIELRQGMRRRHEAKPGDRGSRVVIQLAALAGMFAGIAITRLTSAVPIGQTGGLGWLALGVFWCGVAGRAWCFHTLGRYFTFSVATSADQPVITAGPYRFVRHPGYSAILLALIGLAMFYVSWLGLVVVVVATWLGLAYRINVEERALLEAVGARYADYIATRKRLIPFVW